MAISSNLVRVAFIEETTYGVTPAGGNFTTARFTSESLSGTPDTVESQQIRIDRMSSGQIVTGLAVEGALNFELAKEESIDKLLKSAMYNDWNVASPVTVDLTLDVDNKILTRATGTWGTDPKPIAVGDFLTLSGFIQSENLVQIMVTEITDDTNILFEGPAGMISAVGTGTSYKRADKLTIGTTKKSFSVEKCFTDLTDKAIIYKGMIVGQAELNVSYGELITGSFTFNGNNYQTANGVWDFITNGRTIDPAATTQTMNGSVDMPFLATNVSGNFSQDGFDISSVGITLNNNLSAQNVIGVAAPKDYTPGTAQVQVSLNAYLTNEAWGILSKKLTQDPFALGFTVKNAGGWYGFYMPRVQVSFNDPASGGQNQDVMLDATGTASVGANGESALVIYKS
jgi:hypothetical protein